MKRILLVAASLAFGIVPLIGATLARLSLSDMAAQSTAVVRAKVASSYTTQSGQSIYTHYRLQVSERLKGAATAEVVVRGGVHNGVQQVVPGAPRFNAGGEYVFFLWTAADGSHQVIGLTQGMFSVAADGASDPTVTRNASHELMLDPKTGRAVKDQTLVMRLSELRTLCAGAVK